MLRLCENVEEALAHSKRWQIPLLIFVHASLPESTTNTDNENENVDAALSGLYTTKPHGKKTINTSFNMGSESLANNGAAQRRAFEVILQESRLSSVTVIHFMDPASPAHQLFTAAVPESSQVVPRLHIFPASQQMMSRSVLHGATLTPGYICEAVRFVLRMPPLTKVTEAMGEFVRHVEEVNTVVRHTGTNATSYDSHILHSSSPTSRVGDVTSNSGGSQTGSPAAAALPAVDRKGLHFIALNGLEKREVIVTSPGMTLRTVWMKVQQALARRREATDAGVEMRPRSSGTTFVLRVEPPTTTGGENTSSNSVVELHSIEEASKMDIHTLPHNTVVTVVQNDSPVRGYSSPIPAGAVPLTQSGGTNNNDNKNSSELVKEEGSPRGSKAAVAVECEGGVCKVPFPTSNKTVESERNVKERKQGEEEEGGKEQQKSYASPVVSTPATLENEEEKRKPTTTTATASTSSSSVNIRCSLPDGNTHTVADLDPTVATLAEHVRSQITPLVGNASFVFACPYPPRRFTPEEETETLEKIGLRTSCALRVVLTGGASSSTTPAPRHVDAASFGLMGLVSSLLGRGPAVRPTTSSVGGNANMQTSTSASNTAPARSGGRFRTMAELRAAEEEEENRREARNEQMRRKANRYYGGGSTEYTGRHDDDNEEYNEDMEEKEKKEKEGKKDDDQHAKKNA